jgi:hypothetical protein
LRHMTEDTPLDTTTHEPPMMGSGSPDARRPLVDLHDEYARHADLFREAVDGLVGEDPSQPR